MKLLDVIPFTYGQIVSVIYPHPDAPGEYTYRPAIILEDKMKEGKLTICPITKQVKHLARYPKSFIVEKDSDDGREMGLEHNSLIAPEKIVDINRRMVKNFSFNKTPQSILERIENVR